MKKHTKIYMDFFGYCKDDLIISELSNTQAVDIHHIEPKGIGGSKGKDVIENLIALNREEHNIAHNKVRGKKLPKEYFKKKHKEFIQNFTYYN